MKDPAEVEVPLRKRIYVVGQIWLLWWIAYHALDLFPATVDEIDVLWVQLVFLNIPLQLVLAVASFGCAQSATATIHRVGFRIALLNCLLIAGHIVISLWVEVG